MCGDRLFFVPTGFLIIEYAAPQGGGNTQYQIDLVFLYQFDPGLQAVVFILRENGVVNARAGPLVEKENPMNTVSPVNSSPGKLSRCRGATAGSWGGEHNKGVDHRSIIP
jgi:hypothetical protein